MVTHASNTGVFKSMRLCVMENEKIIILQAFFVIIAQKSRIYITKFRKKPGMEEQVFRIKTGQE